MSEQGFQTKNETLYQVVSELEEGKPFGFDEFFAVLTARASEKESRENLKKVFAFFDFEKTGFLSVKNLRKITKELGENIDDADLQEMIDKTDLDNDGLVSEDEFYQMIARKGKAK
jgi:Ca2+-binding EF-hand superfamily protein